ncbi:hypothetical protein F4680DRAFT_416205 [Xylaria scruposa]|nr:hypothetical protein F4680DRAFT_416205 [Xylaria scruposa]
MAFEAATESIADRVAKSLAVFEAIKTFETLIEPSDSQFVWAQTISDQFSKFKLWAGNIGAHRTGRSSLDYRLRDSSHLHTQVMRLLDDINTSLNEVHSILSGETLPWDQDPGDPNELEELKDLLMNEDFEFETEIGQLMAEITDAIGNLLRLSISLRHPAPHDRFMSTEYAKAHYFEANDVAHTKAKFPRANETLVTRLGQALSQRRQYFRYRESHHEKLARGLFDSGRSIADAQSTVASSIPTERKDPGSVPIYGELDEDERSDTGFSQTSFATTAPESDRLRIPPLPKKAYDGPIECPFCFMLISVSSTNQWKKHVLRDLRPYMCLAETCLTASREYGSRHEWIDHMFQKHWISWVCPYQCGISSITNTDLRQHITKVHGSKTEMELDTVITRCGRSMPPSSPIECPLCQDALESVQQYQRHVGRHQVDLALFALPNIEDDEDPDEAKEDNETISTRSGSYSEAWSDISPTALAEPTEAINTGIQEGAGMGLPEIQISEDNGTESPTTESATAVRDVIRTVRGDPMEEYEHAQKVYERALEEYRSATEEYEGDKEQHEGKDKKYEEMIEKHERAQKEYEGVLEGYERAQIRYVERLEFPRVEYAEWSEQYGGARVRTAAEERKLREAKEQLDAIRERRERYRAKRGTDETPEDMEAWHAVMRSFEERYEKYKKDRADGTYEEGDFIGEYDY